MKPIDLRSDTVTRPSAGMREAMARAEVGDDVYGEDPTVNALEARVADLLGKEAALFVPTGTMANQIAMGLLAGKGDEVLLEQGSHVFAFEGGAIAALWGAQPRGLPGERGILAAAALEAALRPENDHYPRTRAISIENTHNRGGGAVWPLAAVRAVADLAARRGLALHMDGARLLNAVVASGTPARDYAAGCTTVSLCLSKGLGAPAGSLLAGPRDLVREGRRLRKRLGGGMRQSGVLAAAGLWALDHNVDRLREDHEGARLLARRLGDLPGVEIPFPADTNLVFAAFRGRVATDLVARFLAAGVLCNPEGSRPDLVRFVTHLDAPPPLVDEAVGRMIAVLRG
ncbi:MAG: aminotransferase class I/II-fold pyridoxal phosphate-dependent enzyme [Deltaproteobacteria bacterium]|nr:aminotransferase class I/II-fold pyridoxal phosphate-dependent enzyme [Deltaproteobacteria bacterium]